MKSLLVACLLMMSMSGMAQRVFLGAAGVYGDDIQRLGLNLRSAFFVTDHICMGPEFTSFFPYRGQEGDEEVYKNLWEINLNAHYILEFSHHAAFYPLLGLNYSGEREEITHNQETEVEHIRFIGMNLGGGIHLEYGRVLFIVEYDRLIGRLPQNNISLGFYVGIGARESHHPDPHHHD